MSGVSLKRDCASLLPVVVVGLVSTSEPSIVMFFNVTTKVILSQMNGVVAHNLEFVIAGKGSDDQ